MSMTKDDTDYYIRPIACHYRCLMSVFPPCSCYESRTSSAKVTIEVIGNDDELPPPLKVAVCTSFPCRSKTVGTIALLDVVICSFVFLLQIRLNACAQATSRRTFNLNEKVVLKAIGKNMKKQKWKQTSNAALLGAEIAPKAKPTVTVTLREALPLLAKESDPYTFTVTTMFADRERNEASATLFLNYVRFSGASVMLSFMCC